MSKRVVRFQCDYCEKILKTEKGIQRHEKEKCWHRPEHMTCFTCGLFIDKQLKNGGTYRNLYFPNNPMCADGHDAVWEGEPGYEHESEKGVRQFHCSFNEPREDHPGEYRKFSTGSGGPRLVYLEEAQQ